MSEELRMVPAYESLSTSSDSPQRRTRRMDISYGIDDRPPWSLCFILAFQQFLMTFEATFAYPLIIKDAICVDGDNVGLAELISTCAFVAGIATLVQATLGIRLPVIEAVSGSFVAPIFIILSLNPANCPYNYPDIFTNSSLIPEKGSEGHKEIWHRNVQEISGSLMVASSLSVLLGCSGVLRYLIKYIGPLTVAPTLLLIALSLMQTAQDRAQVQWYIAFTTMFLVIVFSQFLSKISIKLPGLQEKVKLFELYSILLALIVSWIICLILTETGVFTDDPNGWGYGARTDSDTTVLKEAAWFYVPYPGQFGAPRVSVAGALGLMTAILASCVESVGNYYACARICNAPVPPASAVSRGIFCEGLLTALSGAWGSCGGTVTYSSNTAAIGISKVGSRLVTQVAAILLIVLGCFGKFGALFTTIPDPIIGGIFYISFGMIGGVGISNLQFVDLASSRNMFILGVSLLFGFSLPSWVQQNQDAIKTGNSDLDSVIVVLCGTSMFVGGLLAFILDNTISGTLEERGMIAWRSHEDSQQVNSSTYDIPLIQSWINRKTVFRYIPVCPGSIIDDELVTNSNGDAEDTPIISNDDAAGQTHDI